MSGVVLRCPSCGTTKGAPGECEACHEAQVRYFCTNHTPGRWLDARACPHCGARFGEPARPTAASTPAAPVRPRVPVPGAVPAPAPASTSTSRPKYPSARPPKASGGGSGDGRERLPPAMDAGLDARAERVKRWSELLRAATRARPVPMEAAPDFKAAPTGRGLGGCLLRLVLLMVFGFVALIGSLFLLGGSLLQLFGSY